MVESKAPSGKVSWIRFSVLLAIHSLMVSRALCGFSYNRTSPVSVPGVQFQSLPEELLTLKLRDNSLAPYTVSLMF